MIAVERDAFAVTQLVEIGRYRWRLALGAEIKIVFGLLDVERPGGEQAAVADVILMRMREAEVADIRGLKPQIGELACQ